MIISLKLKNFRKHEEKTVTLSSGLNVIRAANEGGKSTLIEACLYALFGASVLRDSLAETVTWGKKEGELKVELVLEAGGELYSFTRSKSGAECNYSGGVVTGQKEVSAFASELLGADAAAANRLMLANQNNLRGALEEGPKAIAGQIESLADFDLFDRLLDAAATKWLSGSTSFFEAKVFEVQTSLDAMGGVGELDLSDFDRQIVVAQDAMSTNQRLLDEGDAEYQKARDTYNSAENQRRTYEILAGNLRKATDQKALHAQQLLDAKQTASKPVQQSDIEAARIRLADAQSTSERLRIHAEMVDLMSRYPDLYWEGGKAEFSAAISALQVEVKAKELALAEVTTNLSGVRADTQRLRSQIVTDRDCPTCHRPLENHEEIAELNRNMEKQITTLQVRSDSLVADAESLKSQIKTVTDDLKEMLKIEASATSYESFAIRHGQFLQVDMGYHPPQLRWEGEIPTDQATQQDFQADLDRLLARKEVTDRAASRVDVLTQTLVEDAEYIERIQQQIAENPNPEDIGELKDRYQRVGNSLAIVRHNIVVAQNEIDELLRGKSKAQMDYEALQATRQKLRDDLAEAQANVDKINFNNNLLKKIRAVRPLIADKLWSTVLSAVSTMFTQMRGEPSLVTKDKDGFKVNGSSVKSLSGSTLDLLGLAIRVALVRTFLPNTTFLVLDEPGAAMDDERVTQMLGFIAASGFNQTVLVTHEEISEQFANNLVTL